jgi:hypothetical protein
VQLIFLQIAVTSPITAAEERLKRGVGNGAAYTIEHRRKPDNDECDPLLRCTLGNGVKLAFGAVADLI